MSLHEQVEQLEANYKEARSLIGEIIATLEVNMERGTLFLDEAKTPMSDILCNWKRRKLNLNTIWLEKANSEDIEK